MISPDVRPPFWRRIPDLGNLARHDRVLALADQGVVSAVNLLTTIIIARSCSKEELGLYAAGFSLVILAYSAQKALILTPYTVLNPRFAGSIHRIYKGSNLILNFAFSLLVACALGVAGGVVLRTDPQNHLGPFLLTLAIVMPFILYRELSRMISIAELRFGQALAVDGVAAILQFSGLVILALQGALSARLAFVLSGFACAVAVFGWAVVSRKGVHLQVREVGRDLARNWFYGRWIFGSSLLREISVSLYPWIILTLHGAGPAGIWAACIGVTALYNPVMLALFNEAAPRITHEFAAGGNASVINAVKTTTKTCTLVALPFFVLFLFFGDDLVTLMYGSEFSGNGLTVSLLAASSLALAYGFAYPFGLLALGRPGLDFAGNLASVVVMMTIGLWATRHYGVAGAAIGVFFAHSLAVAIKKSSFQAALRAAVQ